MRQLARAATVLTTVQDRPARNGHEYLGGKQRQRGAASPSWGIATRLIATTSTIPHDSTQILAHCLPAPVRPIAAH